MFNRILVVKYNNLRDNFIYSSSKYLKIGSCVQISYGSKVVYLSVSAQTSQFEHEYISLNSVYAKILGIEENELVTVSETSNLPSVKRITIAPVNPNEYEILELLSENVQSTLLDQIRVVSTGQKFIIWIGSNINVVVYVENVEPKSPGTLDFLTEVVIKPRTDFLEKNSILNDCGSEKDNFILNFDQLKSLKSESKVNEKFRNFCNFKHNLICRLIPVNKLPFAEKIAEKFTDFNVFISKKSLPQSWISNNSKIICSMKLLSLDLVSEKVIYVKLCIIDDYLGESLIQSAFVSNTILEQFGRQVGCRVILTYTEEKPFVSEITISTKKNYLLNVEEKFKSYLAQNSDDLIILNSDIIINIGDCVKCSLKFSPPEAKFCIVDNDLVRNCNFFVNEGATIPNENINDLSKPVKFLESVLNFQTIIDKISSIYTLGENDWENVLITGRPGTGKSTLLKILADKLNSYPNLIFTKVINCKSVKGKTLDSMLKVLSTAFSELVLYQPSMLFLDDLHLLCEAIKGDEAAPNSVYANRISEMLHTYLSMFSQFNKIGICVTAESTSKLNKNIYSSRGSHLFKNLFSITDLSKADRIQLLKYFFEEYTLQNVNFDYLSVKTEGFVIQDVLDFCNKSVFEAYKDGCDASDVVVSTEHFQKALKNACILSLQNVNLHSPGSKDFSDIGGLHNVKKILIENLMWPAQYPKIFANAPLRLQSGLLLYGSPGTGKTLLAAAAARHCGLRLISVKGPELLSKYIGASEQAVRDVFEKAESARPCILFFDEFDSLAPRRGHDNTGVTDRVVNQLLTQLDGVESLSGVCVLAATSRPDLLDPALLRPGRLDRQISCPLPCRDDRLEILEILSRKLDLSTDVNLDVIASSTEGFSGADLQSILYTAQLSTVDHLLDSSKESLDIKRTQICQKHLEDALRKTRPSLPEQERRRYETIYSKFQGGTTIDDFKPGSKATLA